MKKLNEQKCGSGFARFMIKFLILGVVVVVIAFVAAPLFVNERPRPASNRAVAVLASLSVHAELYFDEKGSYEGLCLPTTEVFLEGANSARRYLDLDTPLTAYSTALDAKGDVLCNSSAGSYFIIMRIDDDTNFCVSQKARTKGPITMVSC